MFSTRITDIVLQQIDLERSSSILHFYVTGPELLMCMGY